MKKVGFVVLLVGILAVVLISGCTASAVTGGKGEVKYVEGESDTAQAESGATAAEGEAQWTIAFMWAGTDTPFVPPHIKSFTETAESLGAKVILFDGQWDATKQNTQIDDAIALKVQMISICAVDPKAVVPALKKASEAGIPVMSFNSPLDAEADPYIVGYTGVDCYEQGRVEAGLAVKALNNTGKMAVIQGAPGFSATIDYDRALDDILKEQNSSIEIVARQTANWVVEEATKVTEDFLTRYQDLDMIYPHDDYMATGVIVALKEAGYKPGDIQVLGIGGISEVLQFIKEGWMYGSVLQSPIDEAKYEAERAVEFLKSGESKLDPFYAPIPNPEITKDNVDQFKSEF